MKQLTVLFLVKDNQILLPMKKRGFGEGRYNGVGGKVEPGETIEQAIVRECQEEIGVTPIKFHKAAEIIFDEQHKGVREAIQVHAFVGDTWEGTPIETEEMKPHWFSVHEMPYEHMWADDPFWLPQILEGKLLKCSFKLNDQDRVVEKSIKEVEAF